jgi:hypothetical protein
MKYQVRELDGMLLAVACAMIDPMCGGCRLENRGDHWVGIGADDIGVCFFISDLSAFERMRLMRQYDFTSFQDYAPHRDWRQGGPILEREDIWPSRYYGAAEGKKVYQATLRHTYMQGPTPLIAAMRCYVASKYGGEIELPELSA